MADVFCTNCGHRNPANANFCASCGTALEAREDSTITLSAVDAGDLEEDVAVPTSELRTATGILVVKRGPNAGSRFHLDRDVTRVGRHQDSDIFLDDVTVSRRHVEFVRAGDGYRVRDVGSLNGTYVNRERIEDEAALENGDEVQIGKFKLVFLAGTGPDT